MARKLKTYQTSLGFFDLAIAAPSMKAALEAWGADSNLFHQGAAKESDDPDVIEATMAAPGIVLKRPVGSNGPFREHAELPTDLASGSSKKTGRRQPRKPSKRAHDDAADRKAALALEKEQMQRERERAKEEAVRQKERERRQHAVDKALYALRNRIERFFNRAKNSRRVATRYDKLAANYLAMIQLASMRLWLRAYESTA